MASHTSSTIIDDIWAFDNHITLGKDQCEVRVNVVDRPGPPEGPVEITGVHKNGCKLAWKPPKDDGGLPIEHYVVEKQDQGRYSVLL